MSNPNPRMSKTAATAGVTQAETIAALTTSVQSLDVSRRVGWARSYEALDQKEELERDLNIARGDNLLLSKFCGFSYGILQSLGLEALYDDNFFRGRGGDISSISSAFTQQSISAGKSAGDQWLDRNKRSSEECRSTIEIIEARRAVKRAEMLAAAERRDVGGRLFRKARKAELVSLAKEYGFPAVEVMLNYLKQYREVNP
jgi:hypothetical protein